MARRILLFTAFHGAVIGGNPPVPVCVGTSDMPNGGIDVPTYRAYRIDDGGKFVDHAMFDAAGDAEALDVVRASSEELNFQVWSGARFVGHVDNGHRYEKALLLVPLS